MFTPMIYICRSNIIYPTVGFFNNHFNFYTMKTKLIILSIFATSLIVFNVLICINKNKSDLLAFRNIEALTGDETVYLFHEDCFNDITEDDEGTYYLPSCNNENDGKIYECSSFWVDLTDEKYLALDEGICYTTIND